MKKPFRVVVFWSNNERIGIIAYTKQNAIVFVDGKKGLMIRYTPRVFTDPSFVYGRTRIYYNGQIVEGRDVLHAVAMPFFDITVRIIGAQTDAFLSDCGGAPLVKQKTGFVSLVHSAHLMLACKLAMLLIRSHSNRRKRTVLLTCLGLAEPRASTIATYIMVMASLWSGKDLFRLFSKQESGGNCSLASLPGCNVRGGSLVALRGQKHNGLNVEDVLSRHTWFVDPQEIQLAYEPLTYGNATCAVYDPLVRYEEFAQVKFCCLLTAESERLVMFYHLARRKHLLIEVAPEDYAIYLRWRYRQDVNSGKDTRWLLPGTVPYQNACVSAIPELLHEDSASRFDCWLVAPLTVREIQLLLEPFVEPRTGTFIPPDMKTWEEEVDTFLASPHWGVAGYFASSAGKGLLHYIMKHPVLEQSPNASEGLCEAAIRLCLRQWIVDLRERF